jgi:hypothetical protein
MALGRIRVKLSGWLHRKAVKITQRQICRWMSCTADLGARVATGRKKGRRGRREGAANSSGAAALVPAATQSRGRDSEEVDLEIDVQVHGLREFTHLRSPPHELFNMMILSLSTHHDPEIVKSSLPSFI